MPWEDFSWASRLVQGGWGTWSRVIPGKSRLDQLIPSWPEDRWEIIDDCCFMSWHLGTVCYSAVVTGHTLQPWFSGMVGEVLLPHCGPRVLDGCAQDAPPKSLGAPIGSLVSSRYIFKHSVQFYLTISNILARCKVYIFVTAEESKI